ncbi:hypothetical protein GJ654_17100 [Rhodoblastus acidophilus]|uniref:H repeat-associated protein N-terminal domain-containing protein n=1 Tax=Rhodoblastus acidophilus TaxID=1074 RepID=A0A6N8DT39_RHOAC|nr:transposase family protein [Rhodoblastus acidophilus]MCW2273736.1 hypothetical protein [Rhodoblastus acidophilus]MTV32705.1 hypothetical protein [Rhodoblastus acidophilus]
MRLASSLSGRRTHERLSLHGSGHPRPRRDIQRRRSRRAIPPSEKVRISMWRPNQSEVAIKSLRPLLAILATISDPRRAEGNLYQLPHVSLFSIFVIVSGAHSSRGVQTSFKAPRQALNKAFKIKWKRAPAHTAIRCILPGLDATNVEKAFREHSANLNGAPGGAETCVIAFAVDTALALAHFEIDEKSNEIAAVRILLAELDKKRVDKNRRNATKSERTLAFSPGCAASPTLS